MSILPAFDTFDQNFAAGKSQLLWQWVPADMETPVSAFLKLSQDKPYSLLLESVEGGAVLGRYSAIGLDPDLIWKYQEGKVTINDEIDDQTPIDSLRSQLTDCKIDIVDETIPPMGPSGLFGYMGYDCIRLVEDIPDTNSNDLDVPESIMMRPTMMVLFDNVKNMMCLVTPVRDHSNNTDKSADDIYTEAINRLDTLYDQLSSPVNNAPHTTKLDLPLSIESNMSQENFHDMVVRAKEYILAGDIFSGRPIATF